MLNYCKTILKAVSFNRKLFKKEYKKALLWLSTAEGRELKYWLRSEIIRPKIKTKIQENERYLSKYSVSI
jgi:hypothetical protein